MTPKPLWKPQPGLAWAGCIALTDEGQLCCEPCAGFRTCPSTGSAYHDVAMCEKHGNPVAVSTP
jgi:hypothetical protein